MDAAYYETDSRALTVLSSALRSTGRSTRLRAVAMLARLDCPQRIEWLEGSLNDADANVRATAMAVMAWVMPTAEAPWPAREGCAPDGAAATIEPAGPTELLGERYQWEYAVEVWRIDGLLLGVFAVSTCEEDDGHARSIALGQAILANTGARGDRFDPETAGTFIVSKHRCSRGPTRG